jgi:hypothetical protein
MSDYRQRFTVRSPTGESAECLVALPVYVSEQVKAYADREQMPGGDRFWTGLCEEALANYLWQNAEFPTSGQLRVEELTSGLRRFVENVLGVS